jgi:hypothetical protein
VFIIGNGTFVACTVGVYSCMLQELTAAKHFIDHWLTSFNQWQKPQNFLRFNGEVQRRLTSKQ